MSFQGLLGAIKTVRIVKELMEIWPNEVCDRELFGQIFILFISKMITFRVVIDRSEFCSKDIQNKTFSFIK